MYEEDINDWQYLKNFYFGNYLHRHDITISRKIQCGFL